MRIIIDGFGRRLIDLELLPESHKPAGTSPSVPGCDPHGTTSAQVEQASEPAPGFGFAGTTKTVVAREGEAGDH